MESQVHILVGTKKGVFIIDGDAERRTWTLRGPFCDAWPVNHVIADAATATIYAGGGNEWFGPAVWKSEDLGKTWSHSSAGLAYAEGETPIKAVWSIAPNGKGLYAGVEPAGLFRSEDGGITWSHVEGLRKHPSREHWMPGGGGLILHSIVPHPDNATHLGRHLQRRRILLGRRRRHLAAAQQGHPLRLHARGPALPRVWAVRALGREGSG